MTLEIPKCYICTAFFFCSLRSTVIIQMSSPPSPVPAAHGNDTEDAENACTVGTATGPAALEASEIAHGANNEEGDDNASTGSSGSLNNFGNRPKSKVRSLNLLAFVAAY